MKIDVKEFLPVEIVFHPNWWFNETGISFDRDYFFNPERRVHDEIKMKRVLWEKFGGFGYGEENPAPEPVIGPVHLAAGFMMSSLWGTPVEFFDNGPLLVRPISRTIDELKNMDVPDPEENREFKDLFTLINTLEKRFGFVTGDINWTGIQNLALDIMGQQLFIEYYDHPKEVHMLFEKLMRSIVHVLDLIKKETGTTSQSVNRSIVNIDDTLNIHSNCSVQMISNQIYEEFLLPYEVGLSNLLPPYGIHHCGDNMHNVAKGYARVTEACFFDVGWGADISYCRQVIPDAFFNIRLSPVKIRQCSAAEVETDIVRLLNEAGDLSKIGLCCINMDYGTPDENVARIFEVAERYRNYGG